LTQIFYKRAAIPPGGTIRLEVQFRDSAGLARDTDQFPQIEIANSAGFIVRPASNFGVRRLSEGRYRLQYEVPDGYADGVWKDTWSATLDGFANIARFDFNVTSPGTITATGDTVSSPEMKIGDIPKINFTQEEIFGINMLMQKLRFRLRNTQRKPDGTRCDILSIEDMESFIWLALSEFNATPTFTAYTFADPSIYTIFSDLIVEGAYLKSLPSLIPAEVGREWVVTDDGISVTPASVSGALNNILSALYSEYRAKLKEAKRNHRPAPLGMGAGQLAVAHPTFRRLRNIRYTGQF
jgi:hypothetical protein